MFKTSNTIKEIATALALFQAEVDNVAKDAVNPFFKSKYASLENIITTVKPILAKHGLSYTQFPDETALTTILMHKSGEFIQATAFLMAKDSTPQGQGSAITYMRRYALSSILGIATEDDDDGNAATAKPAAVKPKSSPVPAVVQSGLKKKEIAALCDAKVLAPILSAEEYKAYVLEVTGLALEEGNYDAIIERLKAL